MNTPLDVLFIPTIRKTTTICTYIKNYFYYISVLEPVDELMVYKKNLKRKSIGIRWSYPDENIVNGFIVIAIDENMNNTKQITIEPERCVVWQKLYCTTFENLIPNHQYTIKV